MSTRLESLENELLRELSSTEMAWMEEEILLMQLKKSDNRGKVNS